MSMLRTRIAGWPLHILVVDGEHVMRFPNDDDQRPDTLNTVWLRWNDRSMDEAVQAAMMWLNSGVPQFIQPFTKRALRLAMLGNRPSVPQPLPVVTKPDPRYDYAVWYRGCRVTKVDGYSNGCVEVEFITQGAERSVDCVPMSEVTIRPFRK